MTTRLAAVNLRRRLPVAAVVLALPTLSSCGVNFGAQTDQVYNPSAGVDDRSGSVDVLNALVVSGTNGSGAVIATLVDNDPVNADTLRGVAGAGRDSSLEVTPGGRTAIPAGGLLNLATDGRIMVTGSRVRPGNFLSITFSFDRGKAVTLKAPVVNADNPTYRNVTVPSASPTGSSTGSPSGSASPSSPSATPSTKTPTPSTTKAASPSS
jgi:hypothetical protein